MRVFWHLTARQMAFSQPHSVQLFTCLSSDGCAASFSGYWRKGEDLNLHTVFLRLLVDQQSTALPFRLTPPNMFPLRFMGLEPSPIGGRIKHISYLLLIITSVSAKIRSSISIILPPWLFYLGGRLLFNEVVGSYPRTLFITPDCTPKPADFFIQRYIKPLQFGPKVPGTLLDAAVRIELTQLGL